MQAHNAAIIAILTISALCVPKALAVYCYVCTSNLDPNCHDPFIGRNYHGGNLGGNDNFYSPNYGEGSRDSSSSLVNCEERSPIGYVNRFAGGRSACMKQKIREDGRIVISRSCVYSPVNIGDCSRSPSYLNNRGYLEFCEICDEHGCNSSTKISSMILLPLFLTFISSVFLTNLWMQIN